jgi:hypothetical protein
MSLVREAGDVGGDGGGRRRRHRLSYRLEEAN